jgi:hypothetical protein
MTPHISCNIPEENEAAGDNPMPHSSKTVLSDQCKLKAARRNSVHDIGERDNEEEGCGGDKSKGLEDCPIA